MLYEMGRFWLGMQKNGEWSWVDLGRNVGEAKGYALLAMRSTFSLQLLSTLVSSLLLVISTDESSGDWSGSCAGRIASTTWVANASATGVVSAGVSTTIATACCSSGSLVGSWLGRRD